MDARLAVPIVLLAGALALAGGVERSLERASGAFRVEGGELVTTLAIAGVGGLRPALAWADAPPGAAYFVIVGEDLDAPEGLRIFWVDAGGSAEPRFVAPGPRPSLSHRLRVRVYALRAPLVERPGASPEELADEASGRALSTATWFAGGGWLK